MVYDRKSGVNFLQRQGYLPPYRAPKPRYQTGIGRFHRLPLSPPLPDPEATRTFYLPADPPDRILTIAWPVAGLQPPQEGGTP